MIEQFYLYNQWNRNSYYESGSMEVNKINKMKMFLKCNNSQEPLTGSEATHARKKEPSLRKGENRSHFSLNGWCCFFHPAANKVARLFAKSPGASHAGRV